MNWNVSYGKASHAAKAFNLEKIGIVYVPFRWADVYVIY